MKRFAIVLVLAGIAVLAACGGGGGGNSGNAQMRVGNFIADAPAGISVLVDSNSISSGLGYGQTTAYSSFASGARNIEIRLTTSSTDLISQTQTLDGSASYTYLAAGRLADQLAVLYKDNNTAPASGNFSVRVINASRTVPAIDVYLTAPGAPLSTSVADATVSFPSASTYVSKAAGPFQLRITPAGSKTTVEFDGGSVTYASGQIRTIIITDSTGGGRPLRGVTLNDLN